MTEYACYRAEDLREFVVAVLGHYRVPAPEAELVADVLVESDLRGIDSHGVARLPNYVRRLADGLCEPEARMAIVSERPAGVVIDGGNSLGHVISARAMEMCIQKAATVGVALATVRNSNHFGIAGYYTTLAVQRGMIGMAGTNTGALTAPTFGRERMLGTNAFSFGAPAGDEKPFLLDMATTAASGGKFEIAIRKGEQVPVGWGVDERGAASTDPQVILERGALLTLGSFPELASYKGYGLAVMIDILSGLLSGGLYGPHVEGLSEIGPTRPGGVCHFFLAVDVAAFIAPEEFRRVADEMIRGLRTSAPAVGYSRVYVAGEIEWAAREERLRTGIPLHPKVEDALHRLGEHTHLPPPRSR